MPIPTRLRPTWRGAVQFAVVCALLSLLLPARSIILFVLAACVGFAVGLAAELGFNRQRSGRGRP